MTSNFTNHATNTTAVFDEFYSKYLALAESCRHKEELSDDEKFAICVANGMPLDINKGSDRHHVLLSTKHKCAVIRLDGEWVVVLES